MRIGLTRSRLLALCSVVLLLATGCRTQQDAAAAASQMATTASTLSAYYSSLDRVTQQREDAERAQSAINGVPFGKADLDLLELRRTEFHKRQQMAATVAQLASIFSSITDSKAPADASAAAAKLNDELVAVNAFDQNDTEAQVLKSAVNALVGLLRAHDEVQAARSIAPVAQGLSRFFHAEKPLYLTVNDQYLRVARSNAKSLVARDQVLTHGIYRSSLQPFGLQAAITAPELKTNLQPYLEARIESGFEDRERSSQRAADDLDDSLREMSQRIDQVAAGHPMRATLPPALLEGVKQWILEIKADLGA